MGAIRPDSSWLEVNPALCEMFGYTPDEFTRLNWTELTHPDDLETGQKLFRQLLEGTVNDFVIEKRHIRKSGDIMDAVLAARSVRNPDGGLAYVVVLIEDITLRKMADRREQMRQKVLELVARGRPLPEVMAQVIQSAESIYPQSRCSILLMDNEGTHLTSGAAPSLPGFFTAAVDSIRIGIGVGSCGTAAFTGQRTLVEDIATHPYWDKFKVLAAAAGLGACWSEPILAVTARYWAPSPSIARNRACQTSRKLP